MNTDNQKPIFRCSLCGRIGTGERCCGRETRIPLNDAALQEILPELRTLRRHINLCEHWLNERLEKIFHERLEEIFLPDARISFEEIPGKRQTGTVFNVCQGGLLVSTDPHEPGAIPVNTWVDPTNEARKVHLQHK